MPLHYRPEHKLRLLKVLTDKIHCFGALSKKEQEIIEGLVGDPNPDMCLFKAYMAENDIEANTPVFGEEASKIFGGNTVTHAALYAYDMLRMPQLGKLIAYLIKEERANVYSTDKHGRVYLPKEVERCDPAMKAILERRVDDAKGIIVGKGSYMEFKQFLEREGINDFDSPLGDGYSEHSGPTFTSLLASELVNNKDLEHLEKLLTDYSQLPAREKYKLGPMLENIYHKAASSGWTEGVRKVLASAHTEGLRSKERLKKDALFIAAESGAARLVKELLSESQSDYYLYSTRYKTASQHGKQSNTQENLFDVALSCYHQALSERDKPFNQERAEYKAKAEQYLEVAQVLVDAHKEKEEAKLQEARGKFKTEVEEYEKELKESRWRNTSVGSIIGACTGAIIGVIAIIVSGGVAALGAVFLLAGCSLFMGGVGWCVPSGRRAPELHSPSSHPKAGEWQKQLKEVRGSHTKTREVTKSYEVTADQSLSPDTVVPNAKEAQVRKR